MMMDVYMGDELDKIDDYIKKISDGNKDNGDITRRYS